MKGRGIFVSADGRRTTLGRWLWQRRSNMRMRWWRFERWADRIYCGFGVVLGLRNPEACRGCGKTGLDGWDPTGTNTWCPKCCPDHDYQTEYGVRACIHCGEPVPLDYYQ